MTALALAAWLGLTSRAAAQDLAAMAADLRSADGAVRAQAVEALAHLPAAALPAIRARLFELRRARPGPDEVLQILHAIRRATGSRRADDIVDLAAGVPALLEARRDPAALQVVEPLLLLRSLERIGTTQALATIPEVLRLDPGAWQMEGRRATLRLGDRAAAAIVLARGHEDPAGREWARWSSRELGLDDPGRLVQRLEPRDLADVLEAWGATRTMDAMSVVACFVDDARRLVRDAARRALRSYGQNAVWQAREQMRFRLGVDADASWGWERTMDELFRALDERRLATVRELERRARAALETGDAAAAAESLDRLLTRVPDAASPETAALLGRLGDAWMEVDRMPQARTAYERAVRIAPDAAERARWEARLAFLDAELARARGVLDVAAYRRAAADPSCAPCVAARAALEPQRASGSEAKRRIVLAVAAALAALLGIALLRRPAPGVLAAPEHGVEPAAVDSADATLS